MDHTDTGSAPADGGGDLNTLRSRVLSAINHLSGDPGPSDGPPERAQAGETAGGEPLSQSETGLSQAEACDDHPASGPDASGNTEAKADAECHPQKGVLGDLGIGPALALRLSALGICAPADLIDQDADALAGKLGHLVAVDTLKGWIHRAGGQP